MHVNRANYVFLQSNKNIIIVDNIRCFTSTHQLKGVDNIEYEEHNADKTTNTRLQLHPTTIQRVQS
jgi:hypothetical protein